MDFLGFSWIDRILLNGFLEVSMDILGFLEICLDFLRFLSWIRVVLYVFCLLLSSELSELALSAPVASVWRGLMDMGHCSWAVSIDHWTLKMDGSLLVESCNALECRESTLAEFVAIP